jgi:hypothetical protein
MSDIPNLALLRGGPNTSRPAFQAIVREDGAGRQIDLSHVEIARRHHVGTETSGEIFALEYGPTLRVIGFALGVSEIEYVSRTVT